MNGRRGFWWIAGAVLAGYLLFFHTTFLVPDSGGTYAWCRSLLFDGDVEFSDELARLGWIAGDSRVRFHATTPAGHPGNPFGIGAGLLWMPFVLVAEAGLRLTGAAVSPGGFSDAHLLAASTGTVVYGLAALLLSWVAARRAFPSGALAATLAGGLATPFLAYLYHLPTYSHVAAAFAVALALVAAPQAGEREAPWRYLPCGLAIGLATAVRAQHAALLLLPLALWIPGRGANRRRAAASAGALAVGFLAALVPQLLAWQRIYGSIQIPQGGGFLDLLRPQIAGVLFSAWHGLFPWAPVLLLAIPGGILLARRDRRLAAGVGLAIAAEIWIVASVPDWWGGYAIGARRLVDLTPLFILPLAASFGWMRSRGPAWAVPAVAGAAALANLSLVAQVRSGALSPFRPIDYGELLGAGVAGLARLPSYVATQAITSWSTIQLVVHRDSPVQPRLDAAPGWILSLILIACWGLGLAGILLAARLARRRHG